MHTVRRTSLQYRRKINTVYLFRKAMANADNKKTAAKTVETLDNNSSKPFFLPKNVCPAPVIAPETPDA